MSQLTAEQLALSNYYDYHLIGKNNSDINSINLYLHNFTGHFSSTIVFDNILELPYKQKINVYLESDGGDSRELKKFSNALLNTPKKFDVTCYLIESTGLASYMFLDFNKRIVYPDSIMCVDYGKLLTYGSYHKLKSRKEFFINKADENIKKLEKYFSKEEIEQILNGKEFWLNSDEMLKRGIATHCLKNGELVSYENSKPSKPSKVKEK